jgi:hypothetical protein
MSKEILTPICGMNWKKLRDFPEEFGNKSKGEKIRNEGRVKDGKNNLKHRPWN